MNKNFQNYSYFALRVLLGLLMVVPGLNKLMDPVKVSGMLTGLGFPLPILFAWVLLLSEIVFGIFVLVGWKVKYTALVPAIILTIAVFMVTLPNANGSYTSLIFHLVAIAGYLTLATHGPGVLAVSKH